MSARVPTTAALPRASKSQFISVASQKQRSRMTVHAAGCVLQNAVSVSTAGRLPAGRSARVNTGCGLWQKNVRGSSHWLLAHRELVLRCTHGSLGRLAGNPGAQFVYVRADLSCQARPTGVLDSPIHEPGPLVRSDVKKSFCADDRMLTSCPRARAHSSTASLYVREASADK